MAHPHSESLYPPAQIPKRQTPWFIQLMVVFALLVLAIVAYAFWSMGRMPARTLELPTMEQPASPVNPPDERPQRDAPMPAPITPTPATPR